MSAPVVARAALEGVAYAIRAQLELLVAGGTQVSELRVSGGDARLGTWNQIKADVTGLPVRTIPGDAAVTGVAMLAGIGIGAYRDVDEAVDRCVRPGPVIEPDPASRARYDEASSRHRDLVAASVVRRRDRLMLLRLGINTCFAVKRWPRPDDWAPIVADRFGLRLVQHSLDLVDLTGTTEDDERQAATILAAASAAGLDVASTFTGLAAYSANLLLHPDLAAREAARAWYERVIAFTARLGATTTGGHVGAMSVPDWTDPTRRAERWDDLQASLQALARQAAAAGLDTILVENLAAAREPSTIAMIRELVSPATAGQAAIALCLDVGHMCVPGTSGDDRDPYAWLRQLGPTAPIIQLQQSDADGDHHWPFTPDRNAAGRIDADRVIDALAEGGTDRSDLIVEVIPAFEQDDADVLDDLEATADYWREALGRRGVLAEA